MVFLGRSFPVPTVSLSVSVHKLKEISDELLVHFMGFTFGFFSKAYTLEMRISL